MVCFLADELTIPFVVSYPYGHNTYGKLTVVFVVRLFGSELGDANLNSGEMKSHKVFRRAQKNHTENIP